jgi:hypothetical protein
MLASHAAPPVAAPPARARVSARRASSPARVAAAASPRSTPRVDARARSSLDAASVVAPDDPPSSPPPPRAPRRAALLASLGAFALPGSGDAGSARAADAGDWSSPGLGVIPDRPANYVKSPLGVTYEQINEGVGDPARPGDVAVFHWILRRANGYFIYGSVDCGIGCGNGDPSEYVLGPDGRLIPGLDELLTGMRPGEKRRALVPPELGYVGKGMEPQPPEFGQKRQVEVHAREPLVFEVKLIKVRNKRAA